MPINRRRDRHRNSNCSGANGSGAKCDPSRFTWPVDDDQENGSSCTESDDGKHSFDFADANVCYIDESVGNIDVDVTCDWCGAEGHCLGAAVWKDLRWEKRADE